MMIYLLEQTILQIMIEDYGSGFKVIGVRGSHRERIYDLYQPNKEVQ